MHNKIIIDLLKEYEQIRIKEEQHLREREDEVISCIPEYAEIQEEIIHLMAETSRRVIQDPDLYPEAVETLQLKIPKLKEKQLKLLLENGFPQDYLSMHYHCPICKDTGYTGETVKVKCQCFIQKMLIQTYELSDAQLVENQNFDTFNEHIFPDTPIKGSKISQREYMLNLKTRLLQYVKAFPDNDRKCILFTGKTGLGKTFMLNCLAKAILDRGYTTISITAYKLFDKLFYSVINNMNDSLQLLDNLFEVEVLIIDDLGTETRRNNFTSENLFNILNERFLRGKHTFLSTNLSLPELQDRYSDRITSRLFDTSNTMLIKFVGKDIRIKSNKT